MDNLLGKFLKFVGSIPLLILAIALTVSVVVFGWPYLLFLIIFGRKREDSIEEFGRFIMCILFGAIGIIWFIWSFTYVLHWIGVGG